MTSTNCVDSSARVRVASSEARQGSLSETCEIEEQVARKDRGRRERSHHGRHQNEELPVKNVYCLNCNTQLTSDALRIFKIFRTCSRKDKVQSQKEVSVRQALERTFHISDFDDNQECFLCGLCAPLLELAYNAFQDFLLLTKLGSELQMQLSTSRKCKQLVTIKLDSSSSSNTEMEDCDDDDDEELVPKIVSCSSERSVERGFKQGHRNKVTCMSCGKSFPTQFLLNRHKRKHSSVKSPSKSVQQSLDSTKDKQSKTEDVDFIDEVLHVSQPKSDQLEPAEPDQLMGIDDEDYCSDISEDEDEQANSKRLNSIGKSSNSEIANNSWKLEQRVKGEKPLIQCEVCAKTFRRRDHYKLHLRIHTGEKPYSCSTCEKTFTDPRGLSYHVITHSNERPYCCTICGLTFKRLHHLNDHEKNHNQNVPRPFMCSHCGKSFKSKKHLNSHLVTHRGKDHSCELCFKAFNRKDNLRQHMKKVHGCQKIEGDEDGPNEPSTNGNDGSASITLLMEAGGKSTPKSLSNAVPSEVDAKKDLAVPTGTMPSSERSLEHGVYMHL